MEPAVKVVTHQNKLRFKGWWTVRYEKHWPLFAASLSAAAAIALGWSSPAWFANLDLRMLLTTSIIFGSICLGFVSTSLAILIALRTSLMERIRQTDYLINFRSYIAQGLFSALAVALCSIVLLAVIDVAPRVFVWTAWCGALIYCAACLIRLARIMLSIFMSK